MIGLTISHYRVIEKLGQGGMGVVYLAEDILLGRRVAMKTLNARRSADDQHFRARFLREARAVSALSHQHIAQIYDYGETEDGQPYIVMELVKGKTLVDLMREQSLTIPRSLEIVRQVAEALDEAHHHGIIHRDIKPSNIAVTDRGVVKVLDFGLAKQLAAAAVSEEVAGASVHTQTREGVVVGTPMYLSPEQALGIEVDARSDLFSLGSVLYESIAGRPAFAGRSDIDICAKVIRDNPPPPSEFNGNVPRELDRITEKALAKEREDRYQTAADFITDLCSAQADIEKRGSDQTVTRLLSPAVKTQPSSALATLSDIFKRPRLSIGYLAAGLMVVLVVAAVIWWMTRPKLHTPSPEVQRLYAQGVDAIRASAFLKASKLLQQATAQDKDFALAHARLAEAWTELDYTDKAKDELISAKTDRATLSYDDQIRYDAIASLVQRDFSKAVEDYRVLAPRASAPEQAYAFVDLGRAYEKNEQPDKAIESYLEASKRDPNYPTPFLRLGVTYGRLQKFVEAYAAFDEAYRLFDLHSESEGQTEVLLQRAILLGQQSNTDAARVQLEQALQRASALELKDKQIRTLLNLSNNYIVAGLPAKAEEYSQQGVQLAQANGLENLTTVGLIDIGNAQFQLGHYAEADSLFSRALNLAQLYKGKRSEARAALSFASLRAQQNRPEEVLTYCQTALAYYELGGYRQETCQAYLVRGRAFDEMGQYDQAEKDFRQQLQLAQSVNDISNIGYAHEGLGSVEEHRQNYPAALSHYDEKHKASQSLKKNLGRGYGAVERASILVQLGRADEARAALAEALPIALNEGKQPYKELLATIHLISADLFLTEQNTASAITESAMALDLAQFEFAPVSVRAKSISGVARSLSGQAAAGRKECEDAVTEARGMKDPYQLSQALLALAQAAFNGGDMQAAANAASEAQGRFTANAQHDSGWRALAIQTLIAQKSGDKERARGLSEKARLVLSAIEQSWDSDSYRQYASRRDISAFVKALTA